VNRSLLYRGLAILALVALAVYSAWPLDEKIRLGLDLRGGMHLVLQVKTEDAVRAELDQDQDRLLRFAEKEEIAGLSARADAGEAGEDGAGPVRSFVVAGATAEQADALADLARENLRTSDGDPAWEMTRRGDELVFTMEDVHARNLERQAVSKALDTIRNRVDSFGVAEPVIQPISGTDRILVQLPGVDDPERVRDLIKETAFLEFRLNDYPREGSSGVPREQILAHYGGRVPDHVEILPVRPEEDDTGRATDAAPLYIAVERRSVITGGDLKGAGPDVGQFNEPVVRFNLTPQGGRDFAAATGANVGRGLAILLDRRVVSSPRINSKIGDTGIIEGGFTPQRVADLALILKSGALPAGITYLEERTVGPSLGRDSIRQGLRAGLLGVALVALTMLVVYRLSGINALVALVLDMVLLFGGLAAFNATLTLPGIAGIVLTIGMAVDANVLVFERIKEELRAGRTVRSAIDAGFGKALSSILDANITTLIAALFLFQFGSGPIKGFAVTLSIGILVSVFTAVIVSRWIFDLQLARRERVERLSI
jgi:preprotein translocase subunit SecD